MQGTRRKIARGNPVALAGFGLATMVCLALLLPASAPASKTEWSIFEDPHSLVNAGAEQRAQSLDEIKGLGADTLRIALRWGEVAPDPSSKTKPTFDASDPSA
jgi:hypothetical protein